LWPPADCIIATFPHARALSWQTLAPDGKPVLRERVWLSFQPGEIRTCESCHGVNDVDQAGNPPASNPPEALRAVAALEAGDRCCVCQWL